MAERLSAAQVDEWNAFERRYGPLLVHERIDIGLASVSQILAGGGPDNPLKDFLPTWWNWLDEDEESEADEAGQMIATLRAYAKGWEKRREEATDGGERSGSPDHRRRDEPEGRDLSGDGGDPGVRRVDPDSVGRDEGSDGKLDGVR